MNVIVLCFGFRSRSDNKNPDRVKILKKIVSIKLSLPKIVGILIARILIQSLFYHTKVSLRVGYKMPLCLKNFFINCENILILLAIYV